MGFGAINIALGFSMLIPITTPSAPHYNSIDSGSHKMRVSTILPLLAAVATVSALDPWRIQWFSDKDCKDKIGEKSGSNKDTSGVNPINLQHAKSVHVERGDYDWTVSLQAEGASDGSAPNGCINHGSDYTEARVNTILHSHRVLSDHVLGVLQ